MKDLTLDGVHVQKTYFTEGQLGQALRPDPFATTQFHPHILYHAKLRGRSWDFVIAHELYHLNDDNFRSQFTREVRANWYAAVRHPIGFLRVALMIFSSARLRFYWRRMFYWRRINGK